MAAGIALASVPAEGTERPGTTVVLRSWPDVPLPELVLDNPDLAACLVFSPGWWDVVAPPATLPDGVALGTEVAARLASALGDRAPVEVIVYAANVHEGAPAASAHGQTAVVLVPENSPPNIGLLAQAVAQAVVASELAGAPPDPRCSEPLLALAESLVHAGSYSLATLPSTLKPVRDWLETDAAVDALAPEIAAALDARTPWSSRRARLAQLVRPGGAAPALAHAAAMLLEGRADPSRFLSRPFDLLLEWRENKGDTWPPMPRALKRSMAQPLVAGVAADPGADERRAVEISALTRAVESGEYPPQLAERGAPARIRFRAAAGRRAQGGGDICGWFAAGDLPEGVRTGCRQEKESGGFVYARPARRSSFEIVARSPAGNEVLLLVWPRWVLFPVIVPDGDELAFVDREGVWSVALDASRPPRRLAAGSFRHLAAAPDGRSLAAAMWPEGRLAVIVEDGMRQLEVDGRGGVAWLASDVLLASDGTSLRLGGTSGGTRETSLAVPFTRSLAVRKGVVIATAGTSDDCGIVQLYLAEDRFERRVGLPFPSLGLVPLDDGRVIGGGATLWSWREGSNVEQVGAGLTPGAGL